MSSTLSLLPDDNHFISLEKAKEMTALYNSEKNAVLKPEFQGQNILSVCETFDRSAFDTLLAETGCAGIRVYFGMTPALKVRAIIVGVDQDNKDILPPAGSAGGGSASSGDGVIVEEGRPCPDFCPIPLL